MTDHFFGDEHLQESLAIVNEKRMSNKLRNDRASASPRLDRLFFAFLIQLFDLSEKFLINERTFFD